MNDARHARLLLAILSQRWDEAEALASGRPLQPDLFVDACMQGDVPTFVHVLLEREDRMALVGSEVERRLADVRKKIRHDNLLLIARAEQALEALRRVGVVPVALKGLDLLHRVYGGIDERTLDDVDLLVRPDQLRASIGALEAEGWQLPEEPRRTHYIRTSHHLPMLSPGPIPVDFELHWNLAQEMRYEIDGDALMDQAVPLQVGEHQALRLQDDDLVAHLLLHHFTHYFDRRVKWAVDLQAIVADPAFSWTAVRDKIRAWGATAVCGMSLVHLKKLFPEWIPDEITRELPVAAWRRLLTWPLRTSHPMDLFRGTRRRWVQLYIASVLLERPTLMPRWLAHRAVRGRRQGSNPLDPAGPPQ